MRILDHHKIIAARPPWPTLTNTSTKLWANRPALAAFIATAEDELRLGECLSDLELMDDVRIRRGGIERAIDELSRSRSPKILIVDLSKVDMPLSRVAELSEVCEPGTAVIAIGDANDVGLYRDLARAGVADYVVKPLTTELLAQALATCQSADSAIASDQKLGKLIALVGFRGGVGVTTLAINLAWYFANRQNRRVALVDLDLRHGDCAMALDLKPTPGLREALQSPLRVDGLFLERAMAQCGERLFVLSGEGPLYEEFGFTTEAVESLLQALRSRFHYVIVDLPRIADPSYAVPVKTATRRILVADHTLRAVRDTARFRAEFGHAYDGGRTLVVINRSGEGRRNQTPLGEIEKHIGTRVHTVIPFQSALFASAILQAKPLAARSGRFADCIANIAGEISARPNKVKASWWRRLTQ